MCLQPDSVIWIWQVPHLTDKNVSSLVDKTFPGTGCQLIQYFHAWLVYLNWLGDIKVITVNQERERSFGACIGCWSVLLPFANTTSLSLADGGKQSRSDSKLFMSCSPATPPTRHLIWTFFSKSFPARERLCLHTQSPLEPTLFICFKWCMTV